MNLKQDEQNNLIDERPLRKQLKGKFRRLRTRATLACLRGLETVALTEQQQKLQVCENNWVRGISGAEDG